MSQASPRAAARTLLTLVTGGSSALREAAIVRLIDLHHLDLHHLDQNHRGQDHGGSVNAVMLEGLPDGHAPLTPSETLLLHRIAPACLCCTGNLVLRVTLNRLLRRPPERLFISLADAGHVDALKAWLSAAPYQSLLSLGPDLELPAQD